MNSIIQNLNQLGGQFLNFAWPMLWQSSLLIGLVLAVDLALARKIRASVRHALWLVVLVKLLLPPTLALPTSAAWWLFPARPAIPPPLAGNYTVTFDDSAPSSGFALPSLPLAKPTAPRLNAAGWSLLITGAVSTGLLFWLLFRWWQLAQKVRAASSHENLADALDRARRCTGLPPGTRLKLVSGKMSPAVCGLFRPVILLPRLLLEKLSAQQLHAVLLHEAIHLRRKDIWVNCAQALLQIVYWWHPLVWLANARIRRVREEAADDAVMLALADEAETYAPTLLEVAKLAFSRPLMSLGLVGIMESRSALRQRIERLVDFRPPRQAGLTVASLCGIFMFSAVALPMGEAPGPAENETPPPPVVSAPPATTAQSNPPGPERGRPARAFVLLTAQIYQMPGKDLNDLVSGLQFNPAQSSEDAWWLASPAEFVKLQGGLEKSGLVPLSMPRIQTFSGGPAEFYVSDGPNGTEVMNCLPVVNGGGVDLTVSGQVMNTFANGAVTNRFKAIASMQNHGGMVIPVNGDVRNVVVVIGVQLVTNLPGGGASTQGASADALKAITYKLYHPIGEEALKQKLLAAGVKIPKTAFLYSGSGVFLIRGTPEQLALANGVVRGLNGLPTNNAAATAQNFIASLQRDSPGSPTTNADTLFMRTFRVNPISISSYFQRHGGSETNSPSKMVGTLLRQVGLNLESPAGKSVFYNDTSGVLFVKATASDLDVVERVLQTLNSVLPQIHIKACVYEVPKGTLAGLGKSLNSTNGSDNLTGILTGKNAKAVMQSLQSRKGVEILGEPEITMISGRQAKVKTTQVIGLVTNMIFEETKTNQYGGVQSYAMSPQTRTLECGPILDVIPYVLADGYTINLWVRGLQTEFFGYAKPPKSMATRWVTDSTGVPVGLPSIWPAAQTRSASTDVNLFDDQTMVFSLNQAEQVRFSGPDEKREAIVAKLIHDAQKKNGEKEVLVFLTATIVDAAGNRVHSVDNLPAAPDIVPLPSFEKSFRP